MTRKELFAVTHFYRQFRAKGAKALTAWERAKGHVYFRERLTADVAAFNRRSKAAKKAWKTRKAAML